jgi:hypothetical protein
MENESIKQRRMGIDQKGSQGQIQRAVVLQEEVPRFTTPSINDISINNPPPIGPIVSISDKFSMNDMFMISHGPQFRPIGALLAGLSRLQPIRDSFYERLELSWLAFQCLMCVAFFMHFLYSINDNFN